MAALEKADFEAAEKEFYALPKATAERVLVVANMNARFRGRLTVAQLHAALTEISEAEAAKLAKAKAAEAKKKADQDAIKQFPDKDPKWLLLGWCGVASAPKLAARHRLQQDWAEGSLAGGNDSRASTGFGWQSSAHQHDCDRNQSA